MTSNYKNILKCTKRINRVFNTKILVHTSIIQLALAGGRTKYQQFTESEEGKALLKYGGWDEEDKILEILLGNEQCLENMSEEELMRQELVSLKPGTVAEEFINRADRFGRYPIITAAQNMDIKFVKTLYNLGKNMDVKNDDGSIVVQSRVLFLKSLLKFLVEKELKCSISTKNPCNNPLQVKISQYKPSENNENLKQIIKLLHNDLKQLKLKNKDGKTVLIIAAEKDHLDLVKVCFKLGAYLDETDITGESAFHKASINGNAIIVKYLLTSGVNTSLKDDYGFTALMLACSGGTKEHIEEQKAVVEALLQHGVNTTLKDNNGRTALMIACVLGHKALVEVLLQDGVNTTIKNNDGWTALMWACYSGRKDVVEVLLQDGVNTSLKDNNGRTALMWACCSGRKDVVEVLLQHGVNTSLKDNGGWTAKDIAVEFGFQDIANLFM